MDTGLSHSTRLTQPQKQSLPTLIPLARAHTTRADTHTHTLTQTDTGTDRQTDTHTHARTHARTHTHTHTHTRTHTLTHLANTLKADKYLQIGVKKNKGEYRGEKDDNLRQTSKRGAPISRIPLKTGPVSRPFPLNHLAFPLPNKSAGGVYF